MRQSGGRPGTEKTDVLTTVPPAREVTGAAWSFGCNAAVGLTLFAFSRLRYASETGSHDTFFLASDRTPLRVPRLERAPSRGLGNSTGRCIRLDEHRGKPAQADTVVALV